MSQPEYDRLAAHLEPANTRQVLTLAGLVLVAYELVQSRIIESVKGFFTYGWSLEGGELVDLRYWELIGDDSKGQGPRPRNIDVLRGSLRWLRETGALTDSDTHDLQRLRHARNRLAHRLGVAVVDPDFEIPIDELVQVGPILLKLDAFFGQIEVETDDFFADREVDYSEIRSGVTLVFAHVLNAFSAAAAASEE